VANERAARPRATHAGLRIALVAALLAVLGVVWLVKRIVSSVGQSDEPTAAAIATPERPSSGGDGEDHWEWQGTGAVLLADADGDGTLDLIGRLRFMQAGDSIRIAALSGKTGAPLWQTASLGNYGDSYQGPLMQVGTRLVHADPRGMVRGLEVATGRVLWSFQATDVLRTECLGAPDHLVIELEDLTWIDLALVDGTASPGVAPARCVRPQGDHFEMDAAVTDTSPEPGAPGIAGMGVRRLLRRGDGPEIAVGARSPGSAVPMLARRDDGVVAWKVVVPAANPMDSADLAFEVVTVTDADVCALYLVKGAAPHVTCFDLESGTRRWDVAMAVDKDLSVSPRSLVAREGNLYLTSVGHLQIFDVATGKLRKVIGDL
jgi:outer membrane protein assembly factor BamB